MVKFVHTSDWQMGMKAKHVSEYASEVREARLKAVENVLLAAQEEQSDFIIVAGDLFEDNAVEPVLVQRVVDLLSESPCPVYVISGNHDPLTPSSVYHRRLWEKAIPNIHLLKTTESVQAGEAVLYPCPLFEKSSSVDPTSWIPVEKPDNIRIGIAHGSLLIRDDISSDDFPINPDAAAEHKLDYLALGHWHSSFKYKGSDGVVRTAYSGTHETTKFGESESGQVLAIEIEKPKAEPQIREIPTGTLRWRQWKREVASAEDIRGLMGELEQIENPESVLLEIVLEGTLDVEGLTLMEGEVRPLIETRCLYHRFNTENLLPQPTESELRQLEQRGPLRETIDRLSQMADPESGTPLPEGVTSEEAKQALSLLYRLAKEAQQ